MDKLRQTLEQIWSQLGQLTPTHKMLIGSGVVIMVMAMFLVAQYAGRTEMVNVSVDSDRRSEAINYLQTNGIRYEASDSGVMIPRSRQMDVVKILGENGALGSDASATLLELLKAQPWYANREQNRAIRDAAMGQVLGQVISGWSYVSQATVVVQTPAPRSAVSRSGSKPTASVSLAPKTGELSQEQVEAVAGFVAGAMPDLEPSNVSITNSRTGKRARLKADEDRANVDNFEIRASQERYLEEKILNRLQYIPGVIVAVNAQVDTSQEIVHERTVKPEGKGSAIFPTETTSKETSQSNQSSGGQPGVVPNTGMSVETGGGRDSVDQTKENTESFDVGMGTVDSERTKNQGIPLKINASIGIPRSYFANIWKSANVDATDPPTDQDIQPIMTDWLDRIKSEVEPLIDTDALLAANMSDSSAPPAKGEVAVSMYFDMGPLGLGGGGDGVPAGSLSIPGLGGLSTIGLSARGIGMGALALVSLFFMFRLARGSKKTEDLPTASELVGIPPALRNEYDELIGEADDSDAPMEALELGDDVVQAQKVLEQVDELVTSHPDEASRLLNKWISS